ncbi:site-specific DNA-methyltransferase [Thermomonas sp.]|uniref:site-specific DNA-methyltransferase n=1 Tax=Thermomonas sp. TaxID=1971895 RepID=UPI002C906E26|nr:site-specific DNA-methyltransferase [Thermomonas sp.]HRO62507.1 site-specific DNA-methyltransferase [Thermomonas sp.]
MTELVFKGKEFVYNHHLAVPFRPLEPHPDKSVGEARLDGNLIIHGDNLQALKALLPMYAGRVDCIFIDPPYNTGNEGWAYNDNVNAPFVKEWLNGNPVTIEDGLRHDKWCAMMYPRLRLLHELLSERGSIWMCLDDNEVNRARLLLEEMFGDSRFVALFTVENNRKGRNDKEHVSLTHEYMLVFSNDEYLSAGLQLTEGQRAEFDQVDANGRPYALRDLRKRGSEDRREDRESMWFPIYWDRSANKLHLERQGADDAEIFPLRGDRTEGRWRWGKDRVRDNLGDLVAREGDGRFDIAYKVFLVNDDDEEEVSRRPKSLWTGPEFSTDTATRELKAIFQGKNPLGHSPKPLEQVRRCIELATSKDSIVLDSFAGSGTTAHAVVLQNAKDGGSRKFILAECEGYADKLTAERVRRVINGYSFEGTQKEELLRENITWSAFSRDNARKKILDQVQSYENLDATRFDAIKKTIKDGELIVTGEKRVTEKVDGLGGSFTYCTLGAPIELDALLTGKSLPSFKALAAVLFHMATNTPFDASVVQGDARGVGRLGEASGLCVWLIYKPDLAWLKSKEAALTLEQARKIAEVEPDARHLVFAPARFVSQKLLNAEGLKVEFAPLPYALYKIERG